MLTERWCNVGRVMSLVFSLKQKVHGDVVNRIAHRFLVVFDGDILDQPPAIIALIVVIIAFFRIGFSSAGHKSHSRLDPRAEVHGATLSVVRPTLVVQNAVGVHLKTPLAGHSAAGVQEARRLYIK